MKPQPGSFCFAPSPWRGRVAIVLGGRVASGSPVGTAAAWWGRLGPLAAGGYRPVAPREGQGGQPASQAANFLGGLARCPQGAGSLIFPGFEGARGGAACQPAGGLRTCLPQKRSVRRRTAHRPHRALRAPYHFRALLDCRSGGEGQEGNGSRQLGISQTMRGSSGWTLPSTSGAVTVR